MPHRECLRRRKYVWLILTVSYGLVHASAKVQVQYDAFLAYVKYNMLFMISHLFSLQQGDNITAIMYKSIEDLLLAGLPSVIDAMFTGINYEFA